jgi:hypothetical protein
MLMPTLALGLPIVPAAAGKAGAWVRNRTERDENLRTERSSSRNWLLFSLTSNPTPVASYQFSFRR